MRKQFRFWVNEDKLQEYLDAKTSDYGEFSNFARETFTLMMKNKLDPRSYDDLRKEKLKVDIAWKISQTSLNNKKLGKAIPKGETVEQAHYPPEEKSLNQLINTMWNKFVDTIKQEDRGWLVSCNLCNTGFPMLSSREAAITRFKKHLLETHSEELVRVV